MELRKHQQEAVDLANDILDGRAEPITVAHVVPGGGKSLIPLVMLDTLGSAWSLMWIVPRKTLQRQAAESAKRWFKIDIREAGNEQDPQRGTRGVVTTHQALMESPTTWRHYTQQKRVLLFVDEVHHAAIDADGTMNKLASAIAQLAPAASVYATGTLERRNLSEAIYGVEYVRTAEGRVPDREKVAITYNRAEAIADGAIVPVEFHHVNGLVKWRGGDGSERGTVLSEACKADEAAAIHTAINTDYATSLINSGLEHWAANSDGKAIVVCADQCQARAAELFVSRHGPTYLAISDEGTDAHENIRRFQRSGQPCILVTVAMAYEGLDVPEITHGVCLTRFRSTPWIEQMFARAWRSSGNKDHCVWFVPDDPRMNETIKRIQQEQTLALRDMDEREIRVIDPPVEPTSIVPLSGEAAAVRVSDLDGAAERYTKDQQELVDTLERLGMDPRLPEAAALLDKLQKRDSVNRGTSNGCQRTIREQEDTARATLNRESKRVCRQYKMEHKELNTEVMLLDNLRVADSPLQSLESKIDYLRREYPPRSIWCQV